MTAIDLKRMVLTNHSYYLSDRVDIFNLLLRDNFVYLLLYSQFKNIFSSHLKS